MMQDVTEMRPVCRPVMRDFATREPKKGGAAPVPGQLDFSLAAQSALLAAILDDLAS